MEEVLVSLETAKILKDKFYYDFYSDKNYRGFAYINSKLKTLFYRGEFPNKNVEYSNYYLAFTQSVLQKWLREKHQIVVLVEIGRYQNDYLARIINYQISFSNPKFSNQYKVYEEALESGLQEGLKLIDINKEAQQ